MCVHIPIGAVRVSWVTDVSCDNTRGVSRQSLNIEDVFSRSYNDFTRVAQVLVLLDILTWAI
jgi:hypothetical protein